MGWVDSLLRPLLLFTLYSLEELNYIVGTSVLLSQVPRGYSILDSSP
jgi:hypothetical protein